MDDIVTLYNKAEEEGTAPLPEYLKAAFAPVAFEAVGYPTRVTSDLELWRFADVMQDGRWGETMDALGGLRPREQDLVEHIQIMVHKLTTEMGRGVTPTDALLRAVMVYRWIKEHYPCGQVHEFGPGSGYVGALLLADGHYLYSSTEVTQAFALWQMILHTAIGRERNHYMPWWTWIRSGVRNKAHVITANHMLNEMHPEALSFILVRSQMCLDRQGAFVVEEIGSEVLRPCQGTLDALKKSGLPVHISRAQGPFERL